MMDSNESPILGVHEVSKVITEAIEIVETPQVGDHILAF